MIGLFPTQSAISQTFLPTSCFYKPTKPIEHPQKRPIFSAWAAADTVKDKAVELTDAAAKEYEKASTKAQAKVGGIELYSGKYYAACTVGGILACVRSVLPEMFA
jgi:solute carrier family 25 (mitochondrial phosphate transporter), member 3